MQTPEPLNALNGYILSNEDFNDLVGFFQWLRSVRDFNTQRDTLEPKYNLNNSEYELERLVG